MTEAFGVRDNESTVNLLMTKLSHHNNISVLIVCHELYPKGQKILCCFEINLPAFTSIAFGLMFVKIPHFCKDFVVPAANVLLGVQFGVFDVT